MFYNSLYNYLFHYSDYDLNKYKNVLECVPKINTKILEQNIDINNELVKAVKNYCNTYLEFEKRLIVSLSGGVDSMVLITILKVLEYEVIGAHINYNNRKETKQEQEFLENWCKYNNIKLYFKEITEIKRATCKRLDYEIESKKIRFNFYKEVMEDELTNCILLAHHKDDIVENIFANVCRGRFILDLAVIRETTLIEDVNIMRPLLTHYKSSIYDFAKKYQVPYFKDTTPDWSVRGKYRNNISPLLEDTFMPIVKENLLGLSRQSFEWNGLVMKKIIEPFMEKINYFENNCNFNLDDEYLNYPLCFWRIVFMKIFYKYGKNCPSSKGIETFISAINKNAVCNISVSKQCSCRKVNKTIKIEFKN
jgi:tRNA(Ile)-lysidine synthetase-like protein